MVSMAAIAALSTDPRLKPPLPITAKELFKAVKGAGLPDEIPLNADVVRLQFKASAVDTIATQEHGQRVYLHEIHFADGNVMHLSSGLRGAEVLKITKKGP